MPSSFSELFPQNKLSQLTQPSHKSKPERLASAKMPLNLSLTTNSSRSRVTMVLLMLLPHQRDNAKRDSGLTKTNSTGKWTNSQENLISKTITTPYSSLESSDPHSQRSTPGVFWITHSASEESEDINSFKKTWTCLSTSRITPTPISLTQLTLLTSLRLVRPLLLT